eukprot:4405763-Prymnesium_polylepis.1
MRMREGLVGPAVQKIEGQPMPASIAMSPKAKPFLPRNAASSSAPPVCADATSPKRAQRKIVSRWSTFADAHGGFVVRARRR